MTTTTAGVNSAHPVSLNDPLWTIKHLAVLFDVEIDTAREYGYKESFPAPRRPGRSLLWMPDEVTAWVRSQPPLTREERRRSTPEATAPTPKARPYKPRSGGS